MRPHFESERQAIHEVTSRARRELVDERLNVLSAQARERQVAPDFARHVDRLCVLRFCRGREIAAGDTTVAVREEFAADRLDRAVRCGGAPQPLCLAQRVPELDRMHIVRQADAFALLRGAASGLEVIVGHAVAPHDTVHPARQFNRVFSLS